MQHDPNDFDRASAPLSDGVKHLTDFAVDRVKRLVTAVRDIVSRLRS